MTTGSKSRCWSQLPILPLLLSLLLDSRGVFGIAGGARAGGGAGRHRQAGGRLNADLGRAGLMLSPHPTGGSRWLGKSQERGLVLK